jgi:hypothetical protein
MAKTVEPARSPFERKRRAPWVGWFRGRGRWRKVVYGESERECWAKLMAYHEPLMVETERCVLRGGAMPTTRSREGRSDGNHC